MKTSKANCQELMDADVEFRPKRVRVIADGRTGAVSITYYDRLHTGDSYDELTVKLDDGRTVYGPAKLFEPIEA